jgi:hypothetical protein
MRRVTGRVLSGAVFLWDGLLENGLLEVAFSRGGGRFEIDRPAL